MPEEGIKHYSSTPSNITIT